MNTPLKIGIAGLGTVGIDVFRLLSEHAGLISDRAQRSVVVTAVSSRDKGKNRGIDISNVRWHENPVDLADDKNVDVVVELMGGSDGAAFDIVKTSLENGKPVVTANKALLALRIGEILSLLEKNKSTISCEAAVAGGVPIIKGICEGLAANKISAVYGILNGTCNFLLCKMRSTGRDFDDVLKEAQEKGYAEADPSLDIDGIDAGHKLSILAGMSFGCIPDFSSVYIRGIRNITPMDIVFAEELGYRIKLLGVARQTDKGIEQSVEPCLVPETSPLAVVDGTLNAVYVDGDYIGKVLFTGEGAGGEPTASAVVADIIDVARGRALPFLGLASGKAEILKPADTNKRIGSYFLRLIMLDQMGVLADVSAILRDCCVSIESVLQRGHSFGQPVPVILISHETLEGGILKAVELIGNLKSVVEPPHLMRIETFEHEAFI